MRNTPQAERGDTAGQFDTEISEGTLPRCLLESALHRKRFVLNVPSDLPSTL